LAERRCGCVFAVLASVSATLARALALAAAVPGLGFATAGCNSERAASLAALNCCSSAGEYSPTADDPAALRLPPGDSNPDSTVRGPLRHSARLVNLADAPAAAFAAGVAGAEVPADAVPAAEVLVAAVFADFVRERGPNAAAAPSAD
jgi:hypothetical protein